MFFNCRCVSTAPGVQLYIKLPVLAVDSESFWSTLFPWWLLWSGCVLVLQWQSVTGVCGCRGFQVSGVRKWRLRVYESTGPSKLQGWGFQTREALRGTFKVGILGWVKMQGLCMWQFVAAFWGCMHLCMTMRCLNTYVLAPSRIGKCYATSLLLCCQGIAHAWAPPVLVCYEGKCLGRSYIMYAHMVGNWLGA